MRGWIMLERDDNVSHHLLREVTIRSTVVEIGDRKRYSTICENNSLRGSGVLWRHGGIPTDSFRKMEF